MSGQRREESDLTEDRKQILMNKRAKVTLARMKEREIGPYRGGKKGTDE